MQQVDKTDKVGGLEGEVPIKLTEFNRNTEV